MIMVIGCLFAMWTSLLLCFKGEIRLGRGIGMAFFSVIWKAFAVFGRVVLLIRVLFFAIKDGEWDTPSRGKSNNHLIELALLIDYIYVGLPLGVLTIVELIWYPHRAVIANHTFWQLFKVSGLAVDTISLSVFLMFAIWPRLRNRGETSI
ncbi:hypothetical protein SAMD00019534_046350 [Acytostelium subglobosum LB1]|uniref:hypothetical protein n=1 Tax=Acytostelium subglobosum LB1 TaxID=1410327 RepID=UPI000644BF5A|nr:hypothetical protein SAMD00019534_046350 [Acytostelium subglobosum LB1]GAM21460.1 hypothetical protein SAMD00019534_046350 [Acytostelium subglobosum LB1]|eukprot:XP_012755579.1 hypothetical protein SAMD00019534_046350 [Acytostelium subglobosum LB1]